jgi:hypothetical protein
MLPRPQIQNNPKPRNENRAPLFCGQSLERGSSLIAFLIFERR